MAAAHPARRALAATLLTLTLLAAPAAPAAAEERSEPTPTISVSGSGQVEAVPDLARVTIGVITQARTAATALGDNNRRMAEIFAGMTELGIDKLDIQTSNFSVAPQRTRPKSGTPEPPQIVGYQVSNQVSVTIRDLARLGEVLDRLVRLGANNVHGIQFSVSDAEERLDEARQGAVKDARRKAAILAEAAGVKLGRVLAIREGGGFMPQPMMAARMEMAADVPIATGKQTLSVSVAVDFAIE